MTSYFKLLKFFSWSFLVVSLLTLPHIFVNINGGAITTVTTNTDRMSWTTVGNIGGGSGNYSSMVGRFLVKVACVPRLVLGRRTNAFPTVGHVRRHRKYGRAYPAASYPLSLISAFSNRFMLAKLFLFFSLTHFLCVSLFLSISISLSL